MSGPAKAAANRNRGAKSSKLTDTERHRRFVEMAHEVEASDDPKDFDEAFKKVIESAPKKQLRSD
jgi:hypothetical protein